MRVKSFLGWKGVIPAAAWASGALLPFFIKDTFSLHLSNVIFIGMTLSLAWGILARTGYISFAHNAFLGIGAYTSVYLVMQIHFPFWGAILAAGVMAGLFALLLGGVILRLKGIFFVLSTFCFAQIMMRVFRMAVPITGGANGVRGIPPPVLPFFGPVKSHEGFYLLFYIYATLVVVFTARLFNSNIGREFKAIGEDLFTAETMGIFTTRQKVLAFVISSMIVGFSGSLHAHYTSFISDTTFEMVKAIEVVVYNVVGGMGSIVGPILGTVVMIPLPEFLRGFVAYQIALYGLILILILRFFPGGLWGTIKRIFHPLIRSDRGIDVKHLRLSRGLVDGFSTDFWGRDCERNETLLECHRITRRFGGLAALTEVSFLVRSGEILGIVGPNGAGKSTLFNVITGVFVPTGGTIHFKGREIAGFAPSRINRLGISRVFQATVLYREATVWENVARALIAHSEWSGTKDFFGLERKRQHGIEEQVRTLLKLHGLETASDELARNLPYGFQRLLGLAMALAARPKLLLLDEPVAGMSVEERKTIADILLKLQRSGMAMIIVEHNMDFILHLCPRIVVLNFGEKIAEGGPEAIQNNPRVVQAFLGGRVENP